MRYPMITNPAPTTSNSSYSQIHGRQCLPAVQSFCLTCMHETKSRALPGVVLLRQMKPHNTVKNLITQHSQGIYSTYHESLKRFDHILSSGCGPHENVVTLVWGGVEQMIKLFLSDDRADTTQAEMQILGGSGKGDISYLIQTKSEVPCGENTL
jgi:hypothetical protein